MTSNNHHLSLRNSPAPGSSGTATPTSGSQTITTDPTQQPSATLRLRGASPSTSSGRRIQWAEDVIDNEGMGKKSSKVCCIYHKPHEPGDSDSSSDSDTSDSDSEPDLSRARKAGTGKKRGRGSKKDGEDKGERKPSPNAYERQPKYKGKQKQEG